MPEWSKPWMAALSAVMVLGAWAAQSHATTLIPMTEEQMAQQADWIGMGEIKGTHSEWIGRKLWTMVELSVSDTLKGTPDRSVTVVVLGGTDLQRGFAYVVPGMPNLFPLGAQMLVFGRKTDLAPRGFQPLGLSQGMIFVESDAAVANRQQEQLQLPPSASRPTPPNQKQRADALLNRVRALLSRTNAGGSR